MTADQLKQHIRDFFGDTRRPSGETADGLRDAQELIDELLASIVPSETPDED